MIGGQGGMSDCFLADKTVHLACPQNQGRILKYSSEVRTPEQYATTNRVFSSILRSLIDHLSCHDFQQYPAVVINHVGRNRDLGEQ
jgi:hypothetical protein